MTSSPRSHFSQHPTSASPKQRRQFATLVIMAGMIIVLTWVMLAPFMYRNDATTSKGFVVFQRVGAVLNKTFSAMTSTNDNNESP